MNNTEQHQTYLKVQVWAQNTRLSRELRVMCEYR